MEEQKRFNWSDYDLFCILRFVLRNFWLVLMAALIAVMAAFLAETFVVTPQYTSTTTFSVTSRSSLGAGFGTVAATDTLADQFGEVLQSDIVQQAAARRMGLDAFPATISVSVPPSTNIIQMSITAASPELAYKSALAIIDCHKEYTAMIFSSATLDSINGPVLPHLPSNQAGQQRLLRLAAPLGAAAMVVLLVFLAISADTVQTPSGAKHQIDGQQLSVIYHERTRRSLSDRLRRRKKALLISNPTCSFYYTETIHLLRVLLERQHEKKGSQVFLISSYGENEGKSTIAANLALSLAQKHRRVLLLDADLRKPAQSLIFEQPVDPRRNVSRFLNFGFTEEQLDEATVRIEGTQLKLMPAKAIPRKRVESFSADAFKPLLEALRRKYSYIIIDTPPMGLFVDAEVLGDLADISLLVVRQDTMPAIVINDAIDSLTDTKAEFLGYVLNNVQSFHSVALAGTRGYGYGYGYGYGSGYGYGYGYGYSKSKKTAKTSRQAANRSGGESARADKNGQEAGHNG